MQIGKRLIFSVVFLAAWLFIPVASAQQKSEPPEAPVPAQIVAAKKVFVSNAGGESYSYSGKPSEYGSPNRAYNQFYADMKIWGRYELVSDPGGAELIFMIRFEAGQFLYNDPAPAAWDPKIELVILDPQTHVVLWGFNEHVKWSRKQIPEGIDQAANALVADVKELGNRPLSAASAK